jgi:hypothetical protein
VRRVSGNPALPLALGRDGGTAEPKVFVSRGRAGSFERVGLPRAVRARCAGGPLSPSGMA